MGHVDLQHQIAALGDRIDIANDIGHRALAMHVGRRAQVDREGNLPRDHIGCAGHGVNVSDGPDQSAVVCAAQFLDRGDAFRGTRKRITAQQHRHRAGMAGHPGQVRRQPRRSGDRGDDADRQVFGFQHRPLLDVQFDIGQQFAGRPRRRADMIGIQPELR
jgi:hypothetical protein